MKKFTWAIPWYKETVAERYGEIVYCLSAMLKNPEVDEIVLLAEYCDLQPHEKLRVVKCNGRPYFSDFLPLQNGGIFAIANTDIVMSADDVRRIKNFDAKPDSCIALTRWDFRSASPLYPEQSAGSQDVWIFFDKVKDGLRADFRIGHPGVDNRIAYELKRAGYFVHNCCKDIKAIHHHESKIRRYTMLDTVPPPYLMLPHTRLGEYVEEKSPMGNALRNGIRPAATRLAPILDTVEQVVLGGWTFWKYKGGIYPDYLNHGEARAFIDHIALKYCRGYGIDVGADKWPLEGARPVRNEDHENAYLLPNDEDESLDFAFSSHCIEHLERPGEAISLWCNKVKRGGHVFIYFPSILMELWKPGAPWVGDGHVWSPTVEAIGNMLIHAGCEIVDKSSGHDAYWSEYVCGRKL